MPMRTTRARAPVWLAIIAALLSHKAGAVLVTGMFQKGVSPDGTYTSCLDSTLRSLTGYTFGMHSLGRDTALDPRWADSEGAMLLRFDISAIPSYASVSSATLRIRFAPNEFETTSGYLAAYRLGDPSGTGMWQENTNVTDADYGIADPTNAFGCAAYKRPNVAWTAAGGRVTDSLAATSRAWHVAGIMEWIALDVTADAQLFVRHPATNLGWLVRAETDDTLRGDLFTADAALSSNRPELCVVYELPDSLPPTADAGTDQLLTDADTNGWEMAALDGSASCDLDGLIASYYWSTGGVQIATGATSQAALPLGTSVVTLVVTDDDALTDADTVSIVVRLAPTNEPPVLAAIGDRGATVGSALQFTVSATDLDGDLLSYTASNLPPGAAFMPPQFSWTPAAGQTGAHAGVLFHVSDGRGGTDSEAITITVGEAGSGTTYYVRADGGSTQQCNGLVDAPYPGSGECQPCAWDHPFRALPPGGPPNIAGGDTLIIGPGSYRMGYGAPGADACESSWPWACTMPPVPSGPDPQHPTRILGAGWESGCTNKPELWGAERATFIFNLTGSTNVEIGCLELTDHEGCVEFHSGGIACDRDSYPYGDWCQRGLYAEDSRTVYLHDLDIHGLADAGIQAGRLADWTVEDVRLAGNGLVGWDGDIPGADGNTGTLFFSGFVVEWNGCGETWPGGQATGCWAQTAGGYGDGFGTGATGGNWIFVDCVFRYNTSDGLDLLYVREPGSSILISRTLAEGNAGNQLKTSGPAQIDNCVVAGSCAFFGGKPFTYNVDNCRAGGNAVSLSLAPANQVSVLNCTITSEGDCLVLASCAGTNCNGSESVTLRNNIFLGQTDFFQPWENTCLTYGEGFPVPPFDMDYSIITGVKDAPCPVGPHDLCQSPQLSNMTLAAFDARLRTNSPAIDAGMNLPSVGGDFAGVSRPLDGAGDGTNRLDIGAYEFIHPLADSDGDGMPDADEATAGTDATNAAARFVMEALRAGTDPVLRWPGVAGREYDVFSAPAVTGAWEAAAGGTNLPGSDAPLGFTNAYPDERRFFRVRVRKP